MLNARSLTTLLLALLSATLQAQAAAPNKCVVNGKVTYQQTPCATPEVRKQPTLEELNAAEKKRREATAVAPPTAVPAGVAPARSAPALPALSSGFRCDGRKYCSQMTSCAEAKFFLARCPGVQMDGDRNGVPCERQWCAL
jgi:hypothetical protein